MPILWYYNMYHLLFKNINYLNTLVIVLRSFIIINLGIDLNYIIGKIN